MVEVIDRVEGNVKARVDATRDALGREVTVVKTAVKDVMGLKPVKGVIDLVSDTIDNVGDLVKKQAEITRKWVS